MSLYLLDTNICIFLINQRSGFKNIVERMDGMDREKVGVSSITVAELEFGAAASKRQGDNFKRLERFLLDFEVIAFDRESARPSACSLASPRYAYRTHGFFDRCPRPCLKSHPSHQQHP